MKKIVLIMACVLVTMGVLAQSHTFRDTSYVPYWQFDYDAWVFEDSVHNGKTWSRVLYPDRQSMAFGYDDILQYNYTDDPAGMKVVGLSATIFLVKAQLSTDVPPEYLLLYEATPDSFILKAQVQWDETDTAGRLDARVWLNPLSCQNSSGVDGLSYGYIYGPNHPYYAVKVFDYYFDKPIVVYDSFYVGGTAHGLLGMFSPEPIPGSYSYYITFRPSSIVRFDTACLFPALWKMYHHRDISENYPFNQWYWKPSNQFLMVLPIIEVVDTSFANAPECPRVSGLFLRGGYTDTVTVRWDYDSLHTEYQLWYGPEDGFETRSAIVPLRTNRWVFADASYADVPMIAYVRTVCHEYDTLRYGEWSSPLRFILHHQEGHGDIGVPETGDDLSRFVQLMPNPASGSVLVNSSYVIRRVEAYDVRGEKVMDQPTEGRSAAFDVSAWPKGAYVVLVRTPIGTATKRLVVQ